MSILIAGWDRCPGPLPYSGEVFHWHGRGAFRQPIPESVDLVILVTRFLNHALANRLKEEAGKKNIRLIFARSISGIRRKLGGENAKA